MSDKTPKTWRTMKNKVSGADCSSWRPHGDLPDVCMGKQGTKRGSSRLTGLPALASPLPSHSLFLRHRTRSTMVERGLASPAGGNDPHVTCNVCGRTETLPLEETRVVKAFECPVCSATRELRNRVVAMESKIKEDKYLEKGPDSQLATPTERIKRPETKLQKIKDQQQNLQRRMHALEESAPHSKYIAPLLIERNNDQGTRDSAEWRGTGRVSTAWW